MRPSGRAPDELRPITITRNYTKHAEGSVLIEFGDTKVLCNASVEERVPGFLRGQGQGWVTAEYGMLPRSTGSRMGREPARGDGRSGPSTICAPPAARPSRPLLPRCATRAIPPSRASGGGWADQPQGHLPQQL